MCVRGAMIPRDPEPGRIDGARIWGALPACDRAAGHVWVQLGREYGKNRMFTTLFQSGGGHDKGGSHPRCIPIPVPYDDAGITFPSGAVTVVAGTPFNAAGEGARWINSGTTTRTRLSSWRHWIRLRILIGGIPAATTGTVTITRASDWLAGSDAATLYSIAVDGANGMFQEFEVADVISAPADSLPAVGSDSKFSIYVFATWTGTAPREAHAWYNPYHLYIGCVVPTTLPSGFTARTESDWQRAGDCVTQRAGWPDPHASYLGEDFTTNQAYTFRTSAADPASELVEDIQTPTKGSRRALGYPEYFLDWFFWSLGITGTTAKYWDQLRPPWRAWIDNELKELTYWPSSLGSYVWRFTDSTLLIYNPDLGQFTDTYDSGVVHRATGNGWRNFRALLAVYSPSGSYSSVDITLKVYLDGSLIDTLDFTGASQGDYFDVTDIYPATAAMDAELSTQMEVTLNHSGNASVNVTLLMFASPRCDVPVPTHTVGLDADGNVIEAPGGYRTGETTDPVPLGDTLHCAAGVTSTSWSFGSGTTQRHHRLISFLPPTTGLWRVVPPSGATLGITLGEFPFRFWAQTAVVGRAGKRFFGRAIGFPDDLNGTWQLTSATRTPKTIVDTGTTITTADLSPTTSNNGYLFGEFAASAPGTYRIKVRILPGSAIADDNAWSLRASLTDPYCADDSVRAELRGIPLSATATSSTTPPGSPTTGDTYYLGTGSTGAWENHDGELARWNQLTGWHFHILTETDRIWLTLDGTASFWDGTAWQASASWWHLTLDIEVAEAGTVYLRLEGEEDGEWHNFRSLSPKDRASTLTVGWEAL